MSLAIHSDRVGADQLRFRYRTSSNSGQIFYQNQIDLVQNSSVPLGSGSPENCTASVRDRLQVSDIFNLSVNNDHQVPIIMDDSVLDFGLDLHILIRVLIRTLFRPEPEPPTDIRPVGVHRSGVDRTQSLQ